MNFHFQRSAALATLLLSMPMLSAAQGTLTIGFDTPPLLWNTGVSVHEYSESGMLFNVTPGSTDSFSRVNGDGTAFGIQLAPYGAYIQGQPPVYFGFTDGASFSLSSVDLASYSVAFANFTDYFIGYRADGSVVSTSFSGGGLAFKTYYFGPEWSDLTSVEIPNKFDQPWSLANVVVTVPEPSSTALVAMAALSVLLYRRWLI